MLQTKTRIVCTQLQISSWFFRNRKPEFKDGSQRTAFARKESSPNLCVKYFSQAQVVQGMRMHPCLSTITLEGAVKGAPSAHLEEVPLTASERVIHLTQLLVFVVPLPILLVQQPS